MKKIKLIKWLKQGDTCQITTNTSIFLTEHVPSCKTKLMCVCVCVYIYIYIYMYIYCYIYTYIHI